MWEVAIDEELKKQIESLPIEIQKKLYIYSMRFFWRDYVPLTAKVPTWYHRHIAVERDLYDARDKNIHFMHLSFNTLPENKKWIMGCQCDHCKNYGKGVLGKKYVAREYQKLLMNPEYLYEMVEQTDESDWNHDLGEGGIKYFDPFFGTEHDHSIAGALRNNTPIHFLSELSNLLQFTIENEIDIE